jgi:hypothetical protein
MKKRDRAETETVSVDSSSSSAASSASTIIVTALEPSAKKVHYSPMEFDTSKTLFSSIYPSLLRKARLRSKETCRNWIAKLQDATNDYLNITGVLGIIASYAPYDRWIITTWHKSETLTREDMLLGILEYTCNEDDPLLLHNVVTDDELIREHLRVGKDRLSLSAIWKFQRLIVPFDRNTPLPSIGVYDLLQRAGILTFEIPHENLTDDDYTDGSDAYRLMDLSSGVLAAFIRQCRYDILDWLLYDRTDPFSVKRRWHVERWVNFTVADQLNGSPSYNPNCLYGLKLSRILPEMEVHPVLSYKFAMTWNLLQKAGVFTVYVYKHLHPIAMMLDRAADEYDETKKLDGPKCKQLYERYGYPPERSPKELLAEFWDPKAPIWPPEDDDDEDDDVLLPLSQREGDYDGGGLPLSQPYP